MPYVWPINNLKDVRSTSFQGSLKPVCSVLNVEGRSSDSCSILPSRGYDIDASRFANPKAQQDPEIGRSERSPWQYVLLSEAAATLNPKLKRWDLTE